MTIKKKKDFDCVEMKWKIQEQIYKEIKNLSPKEEIEYFNKKALEGPLGEKYKRVRELLITPNKAANE